jgi:ABC-type transport system involved in cytochrome bd biosynthesis fused ATPase/permease subunit
VIFPFSSCKKGADDRILVLDHGEVVEFGTPWELIQKDGIFRELCRQSGEDTQLMEVSLSHR